MTTLHLFDNPYKYIVPLCGPCFFLLNPGFIKKVKIFQSLMKLYYPVNSYERGRVSLPAGVGIRKGGWVDLGVLLRVGWDDWYFFVGGRLDELRHIARMVFRLLISTVFFFYMLQVVIYLLSVPPL